MKEPRWRTVLCWSAVITFFTIPLVLFVLHLLSDVMPWLHFNEHPNEYQYLRHFFNAISALVFGLAGLNSWDKRLANGKEKPKNVDNP